MVDVQYSQKANQDKDCESVAAVCRGSDISCSV